MKRRKVLIALVLALALANAAFFALRPTGTGADPSMKNSEADIEEVAAHWVAFMPDFEASQRSDPLVFGVHSLPPPDDAFDIIDGQEVLRLSMIAGQCGLEQYVIRNSNDFDDYMPDRLFAQHLSGDQEQCLLVNLPESYQLSQLTSPVMPSQTSWSTDLSSLIAD